MAKKILVTGLALVLMASFAQAVTLQLNATVSTALNAAGEEIEFTTDGNGAITGPAGVYKIDYSFAISDIPADQVGFGNMSFNINMPAGLTVGYNAAEDVTGYMGDMARFGRSTGSTNTLPMWNGNGDIGTSTTDLQYIVVELNNAPWATTGVDYRKTVGQEPLVSNVSSGITRSNSGFIGSAFVAWDGVSTADLTATINQFSTIGNDLKTVIQPAGLKDASGATVSFVGVPEPATMALLGLGALGTLLRRRK